MIIKILGSQSSFRGVSYNEDKIAEGKSESLVAENFVFPEGLTPSKADYVNYLKYYSSNNEKVKEKQFHAVISAKGKEHTPKELVQYAKQYLEKMGYGKNPYLIYFHNDTDNNHVHMVSTRIGPDGKKVDDSFERLKSQEILRGFGMTYGNNIPKDIEWAKNYQISTHGQFISLLESKGIKAKLNKEQVNIYFQGKQHSKIPLKDIPIEKANKLNDDLKIKNKEILKKYSKAMELPELKTYLHEKHGLELVTHQAKGKEEPFGYTLIDHANKSVFKGSELLSIKALLMGKEQEELVKALPGLIKEIDFRNKDWELIKKDLEPIGVTADKAGNIYLKASNERIGKLSKEMVSSLWKNQNKNMVTNTKVLSEKAGEAIARVYRVNDNKATIDPSINTLNYSNLVAIAIHHSKNGTKAYLEENGIEIHQVNGDQLLHDKKNDVALLLGEDLKTLNRFNKEFVKEAPELNNRVKTEMEPGKENQQQSPFNQGTQTSLLEQLLDTSSGVVQDDEDDSTNNKKGKKKKRNFNRSI